MGCVTRRACEAAAIVVHRRPPCDRVARGFGEAPRPRPAAPIGSRSSRPSASRDGFDPTGEYYTYSFAIESNLMVRTLVGYDHVAGRGGQQARARPRDLGPGADERRQDLHLPPQARRQVRPAGRLAQITSKDVLYAIERHRDAEGRRASTASTTRRSPGFDAYARRARRRRSPGSRRRTPSTIVFHLTRPTGDFLYRLAMPATGPIPAEVAELLRRAAGPLRARRRLDGPVHDRGRRQGRRLLVREAQGDVAASTAQTTLTLVRNPDYDPKTDSPAARQNFPDEFQFTVDPNVDRHRRPSRRRRARRRERRRACRRRRSQYVRRPTRRSGSSSTSTRATGTSTSR